MILDVLFKPECLKCKSEILSPLDIKSREDKNMSLNTFSNNYNHFTKIYNEAIMISRRIYITNLFRKSIVYSDTTLEDISD